MSGGRAKEGSASAAGSIRLDKWLWFARIAKSRTLAAALVSDGRIRVNKVRTDKPSQGVKPGDVVTATVRSQVRVLRIVALGARRGPPSEAATLYEELTQPRVALNAPAESSAQSARFGERTAGSGRPTKRERRQTDRLRSETG